MPPAPPPKSAPAARRAGRGPQGNLDSHWDRRLKSGQLQPEITLDLHGHNLDAAYDRLMGGMAQARAIGARSILLVTGKPRPVAAADRGTQRGAIRAKVLDWLAASSHHPAIAAVRRAHQRHGGDGALYIVLKRER
jgi:DNA-nicking Smr family endonuclease